MVSATQQSSRIRRRKQTTNGKANKRERRRLGTPAFAVHPEGYDANAADVVLYSRFEDRAALAHYQTHPLHVAVAGEVRELTTERRSVDYLV